MYRYWGKACASDEQGNSYHLLPYYCLDVAADRLALSDKLRNEHLC
jgi:hypothetical protein